MLTRLDDDDDVRSRLGGDRELVDQIDDRRVIDVVRLHEDAERGAETRVLFELADVGNRLAALVDPLDRVGLDLRAPFGEDAADEQSECDDHEREAHLGRQTTELHDELLDVRDRSFFGRLLEFANPEHGGRHHDADDHEDHDTDGEQHTEVADHRDLRDAQRKEREDAGNGCCDQRRGDVGHRLRDRMVLVVKDDFFFDSVVDLDREVDAQPDQDRQTRDRHEREVDADQSQQRERPEHTDEDGEQREQAPADLEDDEEHDGHHGERSETERQHAAFEVVVDLRQVDGRTGHREIEAVEVGGVEDVDDLLGAGRLLVEAGIAFEDDAADCGRVDRAALDVGERRCQGLADQALFDGRRGDRASRRR